MLPCVWKMDPALLPVTRVRAGSADWVALVVLIRACRLALVMLLLEACQPAPVLGHRASTRSAMSPSRARPARRRLAAWLKHGTMPQRATAGMARSKGPAVSALKHAGKQTWSCDPGRVRGATGDSVPAAWPGHARVRSTSTVHGWDQRPEGTFRFGAHLKGLPGRASSRSPNQGDLGRPRCRASPWVRIPHTAGQEGTVRPNERFGSYSTLTCFSKILLFTAICPKWAHCALLSPPCPQRIH
jgi:hypothetical protein